MRRVWAPVGERPIARLKRGYEWTYLYGFVRPTTGEVFWLILPTVNKELFSLALGEFAKELGAGEDKHIVLVVDRAGWHTSGEVELPEGIHLELLPSGSGAYARGEAVALEQRSHSQPALRRDLRGGRGASRALPTTARSGRDHQEPDQLPLVASDGMTTKELFTRIPYESCKLQILKLPGLDSNLPH